MCDDFDLVCSLQKHLTDISESNYAMVFDYLTKSIFIQTEENLFQLIENILAIPYLRYKSHKHLAKLIHELSNMKEIDKTVFLDYFLQLLFNQMESKILLLQIDLFIFCRFCYDEGVISIGEIINQMKIHSTKSTSSFSLFEFALFHLFSPDIRTENEDYYNSCKEYIEFMVSNMADTLNFFKCLDSFSLLSNSEEMKAFVQNGVLKDSFQAILRDDDSDKLSLACISDNFNFNMVLEAFPTECSYLRNNASLVQFAAFYGAVKCTKFLIMNNADLNRADEQGKLTTDFAIAGGNIEIVRLLEQSGLSFFNSFQTAIEFRQTQIFNWLVNTRENIPHFIDASLIAGAATNSIEALQIAIEIGADINAKLPYSANGIVQSALFSAAYNGSCDALRILVTRKGIDLYNGTQSGLTPFHGAVQSNMLAAVKIFVKIQGLDLNCIDKKGRTPLALAAFYGHVEILKFLLQQKDINVNAQTENKKSPLTLAIQNRKIESIKVLLQDPRVDVNIVDNEMTTPLISCVEWGNFNTLELLLQSQSVDVNACDRIGNTALHWACKNGNLKAAEALLATQKVNINIRNKEGKTAKELAKSPQIKQLFESSSCKIA